MSAEVTRNEERERLVEKDEVENVPCQFIQARHVLALWPFLGFFTLYCLRFNLSVALVAMVKEANHSYTNETKETECKAGGEGDNSTEPVEEGEFEWSETTQGVILGSFFYVYIVTQGPSSVLWSQCPFLDFSVLRPWGWPSVFYVFGTSGCVWLHETPALHPRITKAELDLIESSIGRKEDGSLSALPYAALSLAMLCMGSLADLIRSRKYLSTQNTRKLMNTLGLLIHAGFVIGVSYVGCDYIWAVTLPVLAMGSAGVAMSGFFVNHLDIAPRFSGVLLGITNCIATIPGILGPAVVGIITDHNETIAGWRVVFYITAGVYIVGDGIFRLLAQGEEQSWAGVAAALVYVDESLSVQETSTQARTVFRLNHNRKRSHPDDQ